jgi:hypothetical protein
MRITKGRPGFVFDQALLRHYLLITIVCRAEKFSAIHKGPEKRKGKCLPNSVPPPVFAVQTSSKRILNFIATLA